MKEQLKAQAEIDRHNQSMAQLMYKQALIFKSCGILSLSKFDPKKTVIYGNSYVRTGTGGQRNSSKQKPLYKAILEGKKFDDKHQEIIKIVGTKEEIQKAIWQES